MGYHVHIVNTSVGSSSSKVLSDFNKVSRILQTEFGFLEKVDNGEFKYFYSLEADEYILFYDDEQLWANTTSDDLLELMVEIANHFADGSRVRGDEGETYTAAHDVFFHKDDVSLIFSQETHGEKILSKLIGFAFPIMLSLVLLLFIYINKIFGS